MSTLIQPKAQLVEHLILGSLGDSGEAGQVAVKDIVQAYADATSSISLKPTEINSIEADIESIALFCEAMSPDPAADGAIHQTGKRCRELARRLQPGRVSHACRTQNAGTARGPASQPLSYADALSRRLARSPSADRCQ